MGGTYSTIREERCILGIGGETRGKNNSEDLVAARIILQ